MGDQHELRHFKSMTLDLCCRAVEINGTRFRLTVGEFTILAMLTRRPGALFSRDQLLDALYGAAGGCYTDRTVDSHIKRMRRQGITGIVTHYGSGYCWEDRVFEKRDNAMYAQRLTVPVVPPRCCDHCGAPIS
ncbi:winged helix-turn-helix domain-containing protein [Cypionkella sp. TWP1-2-1b2]|uniref:winged helix-turn-helix domain-containing protein n=1 Tax=Cypionkella sp. TWP1-2-1b2 TaxID=2804675 RepID=UPI003CEC8E15